MALLTYHIFVKSAEALLYLSMSLILSVRSSGGDLCWNGKMT